MQLNMQLNRGLSSMKKLAAIVIGLSVILCGCDREEKRAEQVSIVLPSGEEIQADQQIVTPAETTYESVGPQYYRKVEITRGMSFFGKGAGEVIDGQKPAQIQTGNAPAINITPFGIGAEQGADSKFIGGSGSATWLSRLWDSIKSWFWFGVFGIVALFILPIIFPVLKPFVALIWGGIKKVLTWLPPFFGGLFEHLAAATNRVANSDFVASGEQFKDSLSKLEGLTAEQKQAVLNTWKAANDKKQTTTTQNLVDKIKGA